MLLIRPARDDEAAAVLELWERCGAEPTATDSVERVAALIARGDDSLLVAELDGEPVGTVIAGWDGWRGAIHRLAVVPEHRREGIALALVDEAERQLRERGCLRLAIIVLADNVSGAAFWEAAGYELHADALRYRKLI